MSVLVAKQLVTGNAEIHNMPVGHRLFIQTDADVGISWWDPDANAYGTEETLQAPGGEARSSSYRINVTAASPANIRIVYA